ncbi:MAG TPA: hypothetical protein VMF66_19680 [Candidatus Acidoferrum sp.]|nr:hypothetical protein [Candidatus Acidoferrum sp.]
MTKRPWAVTIVAWLFVVVGLADIVFSLPVVRHEPFRSDSLWPIGLGIIAIVCGLLLLCGNNWARWLAVAWLAFHVVVGGLDSVQKLVVHGLLLAVIAYFLFRHEAEAYFRPAQT